MSFAEAIERWKTEGRASLENGRIKFAPARDEPPREVLRRAYQWIVDRAVVCGAPDLSTGTSSYASYVLLPLLTLVTRQRLLIVGAPGRGKTTIATLMALLSGETLSQVRRNTQHGHPQLTTADLLGGPLPGNLVEAKTASDVDVIWRSWIRRPVKIIDEYNRIPTKTQSALLSLMGEGYAEQFEQVLHAGASSWFLTANDDLGGGTFQVIDALKDRIDALVRAVPFESSRLPLIAERVTRNEQPEELLPEDLRLGANGLERATTEVRAVRIAQPVLDAMGAFAVQLEFCQRASDRLERMTKDTLRVSGRRLGQVCNEDCPLDKRENLCSQSEFGLSTRAHYSWLRYAQALAWLEGRNEVAIEDLKALAPWVLHERLRPNTQSGFFLDSAHKKLLSDRAEWITQLFESALEHFHLHEEDRSVIDELRARTPKDARENRELREEALTLEQRLRDSRELTGLLHEDLLRLRAFVHHLNGLAS